MKTVHFAARLLADAVISERSASTGGHRCLDHIPGACLLGASAATLYGKLGAREAFNVFHSGKVRFGNAYPLDDSGHPTLPVPLSWHMPKGVEQGGDAAGICNMIYATSENFAEWERTGQQQKQMRSGFFSLGGRIVSPTRRYRLKTAIDRNAGGRAAEAQLFGYEALTSGNRWSFNVSFDDDVDQETVDAVVGSLTGAVRVGRSRSAEYGLLEAHPVTFAGSIPSYTPSPLLLLYCASDLALTHPETCAPVLVPEAAHFGITNAELAPDRSYVRVRSYAPFNAARRRSDLERQVIARGSVIAFAKPDGESFTEKEIGILRSRLASGTGSYRQDGLGTLLINPSFLASFQVTPLPDAPVITLPAGAAPETVSLELAEWLKQRERERAAEKDAVSLVEKWIALLVKTPNCPSKSQWGELRNIALRSVDLEKLETGITKLCTHGVAQKQWQKEFRHEGRKLTFHEFLTRVVLKDADENQAKNRLYLLGNRLPRKIAQAKGADL